MASTKSASPAPKSLTKTEVLDAIGAEVGAGFSRQHLTLFLDALATVAQRELKKSGVFILPGFAKFVVVTKPARPVREGVHPFTKEKQVFAAKPAIQGVRAHPVKALKDSLA